MTLSQLRDSDLTPVEIFRAGNHAGDGFDPSDDIDDWTLVTPAETTDDVAVYLDGDPE